MKKSYFNLNENDKLFEILSKETKPKWWEILINDPDLYCNIRKGNRINVYYRGASVMSLRYKDGEIKAEIHNYYLGYEKKLCEQVNVGYGNVELKPEEILCIIPTIKKRVEANKKNIACLEGDEKNGKNYSSEKFVQSQMYIKDKQYIDTEFALQLDDGTDIRIDLVRLSKDGKICFEELKLIDDSRLKPSGKKPAEIITQMGNYDKFIKEASKLKGEKSGPIIVEYYEKVLRIMKNIGILRTEIKPTSVCDYVYLYIEQTYTKKRLKRDASIAKINEVCKTLHSNIEDVVKNYKKQK